MYLKGILLYLTAIPLLPLLYIDGKRLRRAIKSLPEATNPVGQVAYNNNRRLNLTILGESTMAGVGVHSHEEGFAGHLSKALSDLIPSSINYTVLAKSGYTAQQIINKLIN